MAVAGVAPTNLFGLNAGGAGISAGTHVLYGTYNDATGVFTAAQNYVAGVSQDALVAQLGNLESFNAFTGTVVLTGLNQALGAADFV